MARIVTPADVKQLGTILSVWAHPDDESLVAGGLIAAAVKNGQKVICVTATKGEAGQTSDEKKWPVADLAAIRARELRAALDILGVTEQHWLGYHDGACDTVSDTEAVPKLQALIEQYRPDTILTFGPDGLTGHPDHKAVGRWAAVAAKTARPRPQVYHVVCNPDNYEQYLKPLNAKFDIFFKIDQPPLVPEPDCAIALELPKALFEQKWRALAAQESQMERLLALIPDTDRRGVFGHEYFVRYKYS